MYALAILINPSVAQCLACTHCRTRLLGATFCNYTIKFVQICVKVKNIDGYPLHDINILREHDDRLEISLDKGRFDEGAA